MVLILLLMEYGHGVHPMRVFDVLEFYGLNPSFNGIWSWRGLLGMYHPIVISVLILLLMEYGHGVFLLRIGKVQRMRS